MEKDREPCLTTTPLYCGLCDRPTADWDEHVASWEHRENLVSPTLRVQRYLLGQSEVVGCRGA